jgi:acyl carrier protein
MSTDSRLQEFTELFRRVMDNATLVLRRELTARDVPGWDSLFNVTLIVAVEQHYKIRVFLGELDKLRSVGDLIDLIERKVAARTGG